MKKFIAVGCAIALVIVAALLWQYFNRSINRSRLAGTWVVDMGGNVQQVITVALNGSFVCQVGGFTNGETVRLEGTEQIKNGFLVSICTYDSQTNVLVPWTDRARIVRMNDHEMVLQRGDNSSETVVRKIEK